MSGGVVTIVAALALAALAVVVIGAVQGAGARAGRVARSFDGLHVSGNRLVDASGATVQLHGVNRSGTEYSCIQGNGIFDGPSSAASIAAMATWRINIVRVPINEDCWLRINGTGIARWRADSGRPYINAIKRYVERLHAHGMYAELSLIWAAPGRARADYQANAPDEDHAPTVWAGMANAFRNDPNVILAPWGETTVGWSCFIHGCSHEATYGSDQDGGAACGSGCWYYKAAGMQQAVDVMRAAGYTGPIAIPCIAYANVCADPSNGGAAWGGGTWLRDHPRDPEHQLIAEAHVYGGNACDTTRCLKLTMLPILRAGYPLIWGETGERYDFSDCPSTSFMRTLLPWARRHGIGTEAWTWDTWGGCKTGSLIRSYDGAPEGRYGAYVRADYRRSF